MRFAKPVLTMAAEFAVLGKVAGYDSAVLERCGIKSGTELRWKEFSKLVHDNIIGAKKLSEVCGDCQWYSICGRDQ